jgi:2-polyprenyl-3-methyl-5-hydroxy-6-metoxy-1,4-benzoquinol methylase
MSDIHKESKIDHLSHSLEQSDLARTLRRILNRTRSYGTLHTMQRVYAHTLNLIASPILKQIVKAEYRAQRPDILGPNERPLEYSFALRALVRSKYQDVLDVGPGLSPWPAVLMTCGYHVTAIDEMAQYWHGSIVNRHSQVLRDDILSPQIRRRFGIVTCLSTLEHISAHLAAVASMSELLKADGILILSFPYNETTYVPNAYELPEARDYARDVNYVCQIYNRETIRSWLEAAGLRLESQCYFRFFSGDYWGCGERLWPGFEVSLNEPHHLTALVLRRVKL